MFPDAVQAVLSWHTLPHLDVKSLGRLACSCKAGRQLARSASLEVLHKAAATVLPPCHPVLVSHKAAWLTLPATQSALRPCQARQYVQAAVASQDLRTPEEQVSTVKMPVCQDRTQGSPASKTGSASCCIVKMEL
ncbi:hypothetical protein WJX73_007077 [Symbiochloris irregularis]|uniref:Uncharacterized protein n=1 Tax=Symbiochloris irregularis TaxID=706552 RepID=A0AAW1NI61_9CHLO